MGQQYWSSSHTQDETHVNTRVPETPLNKIITININKKPINAL